nr:hypothetical protein CFP56_10253 [Quercus suber]
MRPRLIADTSTATKRWLRGWKGIWGRIETWEEVEGGREPSAGPRMAHVDQQRGSELARTVAARTVSSMVWRHEMPPRHSRSGKDGEMLEARFAVLSGRMI